MASGLVGNYRVSLTSALALLFVVEIRCAISAINLEDVHFFKAEEGQIFNHKCNTTSEQAFWTNNEGFAENTKTLSFFNISRSNTGWYYCFHNESEQNLLETIYIDVQYPAKILSVSTESKPLQVNQTYNLKVTVEGHPEPNTTFISEEHNRLVFQHTGEGSLLVVVDRVDCGDSGTYQLMTSNQLGNNSLPEEILVYCPPSPKRGLQDTFKPRLGEDVLLKVENTGYPYPSYIWTFNGKVLANETQKNTDNYTIDGMKITDFGVYTVAMANNLGSSVYNYTVIADGPPDPVTMLTVNNITSDTANITFMSGYDYGARQSFIVQSFNNGKYEDVVKFDDKSESHMPINVSHVIKNLVLGATYNLTVLSNNSRGEGQRSSSFVLFTTKVPKHPFEVKEGDNVTVQCVASNTTDIHWEDSKGTRITAGEVLTVVYINRSYTGLYKCVGKRYFVPRVILDEIFIDVEYPGKILNISTGNIYLKPNETYLMELVVEGNPTPNITLVKLRDGSVVFSNNETGTLDIIIDSVICTDLGTYLLKVSNKIGEDTRHEDIYVYCPPLVDPTAHIQTKFYPRLGVETSLKIENYGYPYPNYKWTHNKTPIAKHTDLHFGSSVDIKVTMDDFGSYDVDMSNEYGNLDVSFQIIAAGPPDPVTDMKVDNFTYNSVSLSWTSGFNYGSPQTFTLLREQNGKYVDYKNFTDLSDHGLARGEYLVTGLDSSTKYKFTVVSNNKNGTSERSQGVIQFTTSESPSHESEAWKIVGVVFGSLSLVGVFVAVAVCLKKKRDSHKVDGFSIQ